MKSKRPRVQKTWQDFQKRYPESMSILDYRKIVVDVQEILYDVVVPHIIAAHWYSSFNSCRRKNRNI